MSNVSCRVCGTEIPRGSRFCPGCGRTIPVRPLPANKIHPLALLLLILFGTGLVIAILQAIINKSEPSKPQVVKRQAGVQQKTPIPAKYDEAAAVIKACGKPTQDHPQEVYGGNTSKGRALVYRKYNTELWFYRGPESPQWMLLSAFAIPNGDHPLLVAAANKRMPCMKGGLQDHFDSGFSEKEAAKLSAEDRKDAHDMHNSIVASRMEFAKQLDNELAKYGD
jgi:hypothetical protein